MNKKNNNSSRNSGGNNRTSKMKKNNCDRQLEEACMSIIDEMSMASVAILPPMEQQFNTVAAVDANTIDLFNNATWGGFRDSDLFFDQLSVGPCDPTVTYCTTTTEANSSSSVGVEFSPVSMPASNDIDDVEELFGCCDNSNDCSDLLMTDGNTSLDLTIYGQVPLQQTSDCWIKYVDLPGSDVGSEQTTSSGDEPYSYSDLILGLNLHQQQQSLMVDSSSSVHPFFNSTSSASVSHWESELVAGANSHRVLSILEPGLDFEGLIDLDNL